MRTSCGRKRDRDGRRRRDAGALRSDGSACPSGSLVRPRTACSARWADRRRPAAGVRTRTPDRRHRREPVRARRRARGRSSRPTRRRTPAIATSAFGPTVRPATRSRGGYGTSPPSRPGPACGRRSGAPSTRAQTSARAARRGVWGRAPATSAASSSRQLIRPVLRRDRAWTSLGTQTTRIGIRLGGAWLTTDRWSRAHGSDHHASGLAELSAGDSRSGGYGPRSSAWLCSSIASITRSSK
jgi:hypothetical protein